MTTYLKVLALASLPVLGNYLGAWLSEHLSLSEPRLSLALHAAAGIVLAVVGVELMPEALRTGPDWAMCLAFVAGGVFLLAVDKLIERFQGRRPGKSGSAAAWLIYFGVAVDLCQ
jgi:ZIP family zinc transporter